MVSFEEIKIEYKAGAVLGLTALVLSFAVGLAAGNTVLYTFGRALFLCIVFVCLGTGLTMLLRKYVPEVFSAQTGGMSGTAAGEQPAAGEEMFSSAGISAVDTSSPVSSSFEASSAAGTEEPGFVPLGEYVGGQAKLGDEHLQPKSSHSVGKHILEEKGMKYEPKIIAEAIRTMISKDQ
jgi:hypothetical protein